MAGNRLGSGVNWRFLTSQGAFPVKALFEKGLTPILPSSADVILAVSRVFPAVADSIPAVADFIPAVADSIPAVADSIPAVADFIPAVADFIPAVADFIPAVADSIPSVADSIPADARSISSVAESILHDIDAPPDNPNLSLRVGMAQSHRVGRGLTGRAHRPGSRAGASSGDRFLSRGKYISLNCAACCIR